jgi:hypothetical protein
VGWGSWGWCVFVGISNGHLTQVNPFLRKLVRNEHCNCLLPYKVSPVRTSKNNNSPLSAPLFALICAVLAVFLPRTFDLFLDDALNHQTHKGCASSTTRHLTGAALSLTINLIKDRHTQSSMFLPIRENQQVERKALRLRSAIKNPLLVYRKRPGQQFVPVSLLPTGVTAGLAPSWVLAW